MEKTVATKIQKLFDKPVVKEDQKIYKVEIARLAEAVAARPVKKLDIVLGKFPGYGGESPVRAERGNRQRTVESSTLWSLFTNGKRGEYIAFVDIP